MTSIYFN